MHVEWTLERFQQRFADEPGLDELSSFPDDATAEMAYQEVLRQAKKAICKWLIQKDVSKGFEAGFIGQIGYGLKRGESGLSPRYHARFVFKKTKDGPRLFTAYPVERGNV